MDPLKSKQYVVIRSSVTVVALLLVANLLVARVAGDESAVRQVDSPTDAEQSLQLLQLPPGLRVELAAAEPEVIDPIAIRFDEHGRMWVVEMSDYPHGPSEGEEPQSRIRILEDRNGDGRFESSRIFADQLLFVTGVQPWQQGAIVTLSGRVDYMKDTTGDGRADHVETWYEGFTEENPQLRANHPTLGPDNYIYIANGLRGGTVHDVRRPDAPAVSISGMDFRFDPFTGVPEAASGVAQFGLSFDDFGNRFVVSNRNPLIHIVLESEYVGRNPQAAISDVSHDVARAGGDSRIYPISDYWTTSNLHEGQFTSACGVLIYRGDALPDEFYGNGFTCEPSGNLVHREVLEPAGMTFQSEPAREGVEFLASTDTWFCPVSLYVGPDGALYVVDMYRAVIEHPQWMPVELRERPDLRDGDDRGRIYRIVAESWERPRRTPPAELSHEELVDLLQHPNSWQRDTAARLLLERQQTDQAERIAGVARDGETPAGRVRALWVLSGLDRLDRDLVAETLEDPDPRLREQAVRLWDKHFADDDALRARVRKLSGDEDARVRAQAALCLAPIRDQAEVDAIADIAWKNRQDRWSQRAVVIASGDRAARVLAQLTDRATEVDEAPGELAELAGELAALAARTSDEQAREALTALASFATAEPQYAASRLTRVGLAQMAASLARGNRWSEISRQLDNTHRQGLEALLAATAELATSPGANPSERSEAVQLLAHTAVADDALERLARTEPEASVRIAAIDALARRGEERKLWAELLDDFPTVSPRIRNAILNAMLARAERTQLLLDRIDESQIRAGELDQVHTNRLLRHGNEAIQERARQVLAAAVPADRQRVLEEYQVALEMPADPRRGQEVFLNNCSNCHRIGDIGVNVAPDISDSRTKEPAALLADILQPNRAIDNNYVMYQVVAVDGRVLSGILETETTHSITLHKPDDERVTLLREDIEEIRSTGLSLMPEGLESDIPPQDMADLLSFIKNWRYLDGQIPIDLPGGE